MEEEDLILIAQEQARQSQPILRVLKSIEREVSATRILQEKSNAHLSYDIDLSKAHTNFEVADYTKDDLEMDCINILPVPSAVSFKLRGIEDRNIDLNSGDNYSLSGHLITRILVTNSVGSGIVKVHIYGKRRVRLL